jgi:predicted glutamine amidotransferase
LNNLWSDNSFQSISKIISSKHIFASVRNATPPSPVDEQSIQPFTKGPYLFMHNGHIKKYHRKLKRTLNDLIPDDLYTTLYSHADSATIFLLLFDKLRNSSPTLENMTRSLLDTVYLIEEYAGKAGVICHLNLALTNGKDMIFTRYSNTDESNTLYFIQDGEAFPGSVVIASEPLNDESGWKPLSHNHLITVSESADINIKKIES